MDLIIIDIIISILFSLAEASADTKRRENSKKKTKTTTNIVVHIIGLWAFSATKLHSKNFRSIGKLVGVRVVSRETESVFEREREIERVFVFRVN
jgi:hypothetical protein